jgi:hypothetical protein
MWHLQTYNHVHNGLASNSNFPFQGSLPLLKTKSQVHKGLTRFFYFSTAAPKKDHKRLIRPPKGASDFSWKSSKAHLFLLTMLIWCISLVLVRDLALCARWSRHQISEVLGRLKTLVHQFASCAKLPHFTPLMSGRRISISFLGQ